MKPTHLLLMLLCTLAPTCFGAEVQTPLRDLEGLLKHVREVQAEERALQQRLEAEFIANRNAQQSMLEQARKAANAQQQMTQPLQDAIEQNKQLIASLRKELQTVTSGVGDIYPTYRDYANRFAQQLNASLISSQYPQRRALLHEVNPQDREANAEQMQQLWLLLQEELTAQSTIARYTSPVVDTAGMVTPRELVRIGPFVATANGNFMRYIPETGELLLLSRQPDASSRRDMAKLQEASSSEPLLVHVDPTQGELLALLVQTPDLLERTAQGKEIGYITLALGAAGLILFMIRITWLFLTKRAVIKQMQNGNPPSPNNPLGRVLLAADKHQLVDEALQLSLDDAVLKELPAIERGQSLLKLLAAVAPLLGLLGTVTGMIETFQAISLFGSGDPQMMAGGISQALVTTVIGLVVAIPLLFCHSLLVSRSRELVQLLDEQSAGVLVRRAEAGRR